MLLTLDRTGARRAMIVCQSNRPAQVRATKPGRFIWHGTHRRRVDWRSRDARSTPICAPHLMNAVGLVAVPNERILVH
jgi:hypothetical protein